MSPFSLPWKKLIWKTFDVHMAMSTFFAIGYGKKLPFELLPGQKKWALAFQVFPIWWTQCIIPGHLPSLVSSSLFFSSLAPKQVVKKTKRSQHFSFLELSWKWCLFDTLVPAEKLYIQSTLNTDLIQDKVMDKVMYGIDNGLQLQ